MHTPVEITVYRWLKLMGIQVSKPYIIQRLGSHPDHPSALSITCLLDDLGIENVVAEVDESQLTELSVPFLALIDGLGFTLIEDVRQEEKTIPDFKKRWKRIVILAEKPEKVRKSAELIKTEVVAKRNKTRWILAGLVLFLLFISCFPHLDQPMIILLLPAFWGLIVSGSIVLSELGAETMISRRLCGAGDEAGCQKVINSQLSNLPLGLKLSDLGVSFFAGIILTVLISGLANIAFQKQTHLLISIASVGSIPFTLVSVYYQSIVLKQWCKSCLQIVGTLWVLAFISIWQYPESIAPFDLITSAGVLGIFVSPAVVWLFTRSFLNQKKELVSRNIRLQRVSRSTELFTNYLFTQRKVDVTPKDYDFQIGNPDAPLQLMVVSSPSCGPCTETHSLLRSLLQRYPSQLGITIRFLINYQQEDHPNTLAIEHMLQYALTHPSFLNNPQKVDQMLSYWYETMNLKTFRSRYVVKEDIFFKPIVKELTEWCHLAGIQYTPTIFINGYLLEIPYEPDDLTEHTASLIEVLSEMLSLSEEAIVANH